MKLSREDLKVIIESVMLENMDLHRTIMGALVPIESIECYDDICSRIEDAVYCRNQCPRGSASRSHYNGILSTLRTKKNRLQKMHSDHFEMENK